MSGFQEVKEKICLAIKHEFNEIKVKLASERIQVLHKCNVPAFRELLCHVSHFALKEIHLQYEKIKHGNIYKDYNFTLLHAINFTLTLITIWFFQVR